MANQIPQALQYLTQYLGAENQRLEKLSKERQINETLSTVADKFRQLGPEAKPEDARAIFFDALSSAAKAGTATEVSPFVQGIYNDSLKYIQEEKATRQDQALKTALGQEFGLPEHPGLTGTQETQLLDLETRISKTSTYKDKGGQSGIVTLTFKNGSYQEKPGSRIELSSTTYEDELKRKLAVVRAEAELRNRFTQRAVTNTPYTTQVVVNGKKVTVPIEHSGDINMGYFYRDPFTNKPIPWSPTTGDLGKYTDPTMQTYRELRNAGLIDKSKKYLYAQANGPAQGLMGLIKATGKLPAEYTNVITNIQTNGLTAETTPLLRGMLKTKTSNGSNVLLDQINNMPDETQRSVAMNMYNEVVDKLSILDEPTTPHGASQPKEETWTPDLKDQYYNYISDTFATAKQPDLYAIQKMMATYFAPFKEKAASSITLQDFTTGLSDKDKLYLMERLRSAQK